jgi:MFS family permease
VARLTPDGGGASSLWHHGDFLRLWAGQTVSEFGAQVSAVALPLTAVLLLHADAFQMGILGAMTTLPFVLVGLFAGVFVDRRRRRPLLVAADAGRAVLVALVPVLALLHRLDIFLLDAVAFAVGCLTVLFDVAYQSYLPAVVGRAALVEGNARLEASRALSQVAGPSIGGALVGALTAPVAVTVNAITYVLSVASLLAIRRVEPAPEPPAERRVLPLIGEGLHWVLGHPMLRAIAGCTGTSNFFGQMGLAVYVLFAVHRIGLSPALLGLVYAGSSLGGLAGAAGADRVADRLGIGRALVVGAVCFTAFALLVPLAPDRVALALPLLLAAGFGTGFGSTVYNVTQVSMRQRITPDALLGRMNASMRFIVWGTIPFGSFAGGVLGSHIGLRPTLWLAAVGGLTSVLWIVLSPLGRARAAEVDAAAAPAPGVAGG